jgi:hypothetical protein
MRIVAIAGIAFALALPGWAAPPRRATLELASLTPLVVQGTSFGRAEPVAVIASYPGAQQIVNVTAHRNGRFRVNFTLVVKRCTPLTVRAIGARGSRAVLQVDPGCKPPREDDRRRRR